MSTVFSKLHETQRLADWLLNFFFGDVTFLEQPEGNIFPYGERIEQRAFLKNHANLAPQVEQILFPHLGDIFAQHMNVSCVGLHKSERELENRALP